jgi:hypothetical protein
MNLSARATYIGGPTALIEIGGLRLLTDPTFDAAGSVYETAVYTLRKTMGPAIPIDGIGPIDAVLLSHDHHFDNLDHAGRVALTRATRVFAPAPAVERLGRGTAGLPRAADVPAIYVSGDTVWYEGVEEVARRADVRVAFLNMGAARVAEVGPAHLTFTAEEGVEVARAMPQAMIVPLPA